MTPVGALATRLTTPERATGGGQSARDWVTRSRRPDSGGARPTLEDWLAGHRPAAHPPRRARLPRPATAPSHRQVRVESNVADVHRMHGRGSTRALLRQYVGSKYIRTLTRVGLDVDPAPLEEIEGAESHRMARLLSITLDAAYRVTWGAGDCFFDANLSLDCIPVGWAGGLRGWGRFRSLPIMLVIVGGLPAGESVAVTWSLSATCRFTCQA